MTNNTLTHCKIVNPKGVYRTTGKKNWFSVGVDVVFFFLSHSIPFSAQKRGLAFKCVFARCVCHFISLSRLLCLLKHMSICAEDNRVTDFQRIASMPPLSNSERVWWTETGSKEAHTRTHQSIQMWFFSVIFFFFATLNSHFFFSSELMIMVIIVLWCNPSLFGILALNQMIVQYLPLAAHTLKQNIAYGIRSNNGFCLKCVFNRSAWNM